MKKIEFEELNRVETEDKTNCYNKNEFVIFWEKTTDVLYLKHGLSLTAMVNHKTGLPLTYEDWKENYGK